MGGLSLTMTEVRMLGGHSRQELAFYNVGSAFGGAAFAIWLTNVGLDDAAWMAMEPWKQGLLQIGPVVALVLCVALWVAAIFAGRERRDIIDTALEETPGAVRRRTTILDAIRQRIIRKLTAE